MTSKNLEDISKEILNYAKNQGFNIFYSKELSTEYDLAEAIWDQGSEWKEFFNIAKDEDIKTIIANIQVFRKDDAFKIDDENNPLLDQALTQSKILDLEELSKLDGKVGSYTFSWIKNGVRYSLSEITEWYKDYKSVMSSIESEITRQQPMGILADYYGGKESQTQEIPEVLKKKSEEELANEMAEFMRKESPTPDTRDFYVLRRMFWAEKGIERFSLNPKVELIRDRIDMKAQKILEEEQTKEEKEKIPKLLEQCIQWCNKNNIKKATQGDIGAFLVDNETSLSRDGQRKLWQKVNVMLKSK